MLRVFSDAGYTNQRSFDIGTVVLTLGTGATQESTRARRRPGVPRRGPLAAADAAALVGRRGRRPRPTAPGSGRPCSARSSPPGSRAGWWPSTRGPRELAGVPTYPSLLDVPDGLDLVVICVPAGLVLDVFRDAVAAGVRAAVIVSSGLRRARRRGRADPARLATLARAHDVRMVGPNCLGLLCNHPDVRLNATFTRRAARRWPGRRQPVRRRRHRAHGPRSRARPRRAHLRLAGQQGRRLQQRPARGVVRRPRRHRGGALPRVVRQLGQVRAVRAALRPAQAAAGGRRRPVRRWQPGRRLAHRGGGHARGRGGRAVRAGRA